MTAKKKLPGNRQKTGKTKKNKTSFSPGQSGNPSGRPKLPVEISELKKLSREELIKTYVHYALMSPDDFYQCKPQTMAEMGMKSVFAGYAETGDSKSIKNIWEYVLGKPQIELPESGTVKIVFGQEEADL